MKKIATIVALSLTLFSCKNTQTTEETNTDSTIVANDGTTVPAPAVDTLSTTPVSSSETCYLRTEGNDKDSLIVTLTITGDSVNGYLIYNYYQKDGRFGKLHGTKNSNVVDAQWVYMQEGMLDSTKVSFRLNDNTIEQKENGYDAKTGKEILKDDASYSRSYNKVDCSVTKELVAQVKRFL